MLSGGYCTDIELKKKWRDGVEMKRECESLYLKTSFSFAPFALCLLNGFLGVGYVANASHSTSRYSSCLKMILCLVQFKLCAE